MPLPFPIYEIVFDFMRISGGGSNRYCGAQVSCTAPDAGSIFIGLVPSSWLLLSVYRIW
jgi:hypothetical protein